MRISEPVRVIVYGPTEEKKQAELARQVAELHADFVVAAIEQLNCPMEQKRKLLQDVIDDVSGRSRG